VGQAGVSLATGSPFDIVRTMVASLLTEKGDKQSGFTELPRPDRLPDGSEPEERLVVCGISWKRYLAYDKQLGDDRPGPRFFYLDGELEIVSTSNEHERLKEWIGGCMEDYFLANDIEIATRGQATMRKRLKAVGAEPDKSWCIGEEKQFPDLVLEIALTSGGVSKLEIYRRMEIPEVWFWRRNRLEIFALESSGRYEALPVSRLLPGLDIQLLERCCAIRSWTEARKTFRAALASSKRRRD
jgi:Uma2 family endonuclease